MVTTLLRFKLIFIAFLACTSLLAQAPAGPDNLKIEYESLSTAPDFINICGGSEKVTVLITNKSANSPTKKDITAVIKLFKGVNFVKLILAETTPGVTVIDSTNKNSPKLKLPNLSAFAEGGIRITFEIRADCSVLDELIANPNVSVFDTWTVKYNFGDGEGSTEVKKLSEYRDAFAVAFFTIAPQKNYTAKKGGDCFSRNITINNSGLEGFVSSIQYKNLQAKGVSIKSILINGQPIVVKKQAQANGDTLITADITGNYFKLNKKGTGGAGNGNESFDPDENVIVTENVCIANCNFPTSSTHSSSWGCYGRICNTVTANDIIPIGVGNANPLFTVNDPTDKNVGYCQEGTSTVTIKNDGFEVDAGFGVMKNLVSGIGFGGTFQTQVKGYKMTSLTIAGKTIPLVFNTAANNALINMDKNPLFATDPDGPGGLEDADSDGYFDDLKIGQSIKIVAKYAFDCSTAMDTAKACTNNRNLGLTSVLKYQDACNQYVTKDKPSYKNITNANNAYEDISETDAQIGVKDTFFIKHTEERSIFFFEKNGGGKEQFYAKVYLPKGVKPIIGATGLFKNSNTAPIKMLSNNIKNDTLYMYFDGTDQYLTGKYTLKMAFEADCNANVGPTKFPFEFGFYTPTCACYATWYCNTISGPVLHGNNTCKLPPCPKGIRTTSFDVQRTTFGYTDATYKKAVDPSKVDKNVAISCDSVRMNIKNTVGDTPLNDKVGFVIEYSNIEEKDVEPNDPKAIFLFGSGRLRIKQGGVNKYCNIAAAAASTVATGKDKKTTIDVSSCLKTNNITLKPGDEVEFIGSFEVNPEGPYSVQFKVIPNLRAYGFANITGTDYICDDYGKNFTLAKNKTVFDFPNSGSFPKGCEVAQLEYRLITINNGFYDYFPNEFRAAIKVDSIRLKFDPKMLDAFSKLDVEYSIPGHPVYGDAFVPLPSMKQFTNGLYRVKFDTVDVIPAYNNISYYSFNLRINALPNCKSKFGSATGDNRFDFDATMSYKDRYYAKALGNGMCSPDSLVFVDNDIYYNEPPTFTFNAASNPNYDVTAGIAEWSVKMCNTSFTSDAGASFMTMDLQKGKLKLIEATDISDPLKSAKLDIKSYSNNDFAFVLTKKLLKSDGNNAPSQVCNTVKFKAEINDCSTIETTVSGGWDCTPYNVATWNPLQNPPCDEFSTTLRALILEPSLDALLTEGFKKEPDLCDTIALDLLVRNTGRANAFNVKTQLILPAIGAVLIPGSISVAYPSGAAFKPVKADPIKVGSGVKGDIYEFTDFKNVNDFLDKNGLAGFNPTIPNDSNQFIIRYKVITDCKFKSGTVSYFNVQGEKGCGEPTNLEAGESLPIKLKGAVFSTDQRFFDIALTDKTIIVPSATSFIELIVTNTTPNPSDTTDLFSINLPPDLEYIPNSATGVLPVGWIPGEPEIIDIGVYKILTFKIPVGLKKGDEAILNFKVTTPNFDCNSAPVFDATIATVIRRKVSCKINPLDPPCIVSVVTSNGGDATLELPVGVGAKLSLDFARPTSKCFDFAQEKISIKGFIVNKDSADITATTLEMTYYYDKNDNEIYDAGEKVIKIFKFNGPLAVGASIPFSHEITASVDDICKIKAEIKAEGATCGVNSFALPTPQLLNAGPDKGFCASGEKVTHILGDDNCTHNTYKYKWTALAAGSLQYLSSTTIANPTLNFVWNANQPSEYCFVLQTDRGNGCTPTSDTVCIRRSPALVLTMGKNLQTPPNTSIKLSPAVSGGTPPYSYNWDPASALDNPKSAMPLAKPNGTVLFSLTVTDAAGCSAIGSIVVTTHLCDTITAVVSNDTTICAGQKVQLQAGGGTNYWWIPDPANPSGGSLNQYYVPNPIFTSTVPNTIYRFTVLVTSTTQQNAMDTASVYIKVTGGPTATIDLAQGSNACSGGAPVTLTGSGGSTYMWSDATGLPLGNNASLQVSPSTTTTYTLKVTDNSGCIATTTKTITPSAAPIALASPDVTICEGKATTISAVASGGSNGAFVYTWTPSATLTNPSSATTNAQPTVTTVYNVVVVDQNGCTATDNVRVQVDSCSNCTKPEIDAPVVTKVDCGKTNGAIAVTVKGDVADNYTFVWTPNSGTTSSNGTTKTGLAVGTYSVLVTRKDDAKCFKSFTIDVPANVAPKVNITVSDKTIPDCDEPNGSVSFSINYGAGFVFPADTTITNANGVVVKNGKLAKGTYTITIKDKIGCSTGSTTFSIDTCFTIPCMKPTLDVIEVSKAICGKNNGSIHLTPWGNPMKYIYTWTPDLGTTGGAGETKTNIPGGNYTVSLAFMANPLCKATFTINVPNVDFAKANIQVLSTKAAECDSLGAVTIAATFDSGFLFPADTTIVQNGKIVKNGHLKSGNYIVQIRNINSCVTAEAPFTITKGGCSTGNPTKDSTVIATINVGLLTNVKCFGGANGKIDFTVAYGSKFAQPANITIFDKNKNIVTNNGALVAGEYCIVVKDKNGIVQAEKCVTLTQPDAMTVTPTATEACKGKGGAIALAVNGGTAPYTYDWADLSGTKDVKNRSGLALGKYSVVVADVNACTAAANDIEIKMCKDTTGVVIDPTDSTLIATVNIIGTSGIKCHGEATGKVDYTVAYGSKFVKPATITIFNQNVNTAVTNGTLTAGTYSIIVLDGNGVERGKTIFTVTQPALLTATSLINDACKGVKGSIAIKASGGTTPYTYNWSDIGLGADNRNTLDNGTYAVTVSDANACSIALTNLIIKTCKDSTVVDPTDSTKIATVSITSISNVLCFGQTNGSVTYNVVYGSKFAKPATITIVDKNNVEVTSGSLGAGDYYVVVKDANGIERAKQIFTVKQSPALVVGATTTPVCNGKGGAIQLFVNGGTTPYSYNWSDLAGTNDPADRTDLEVGSYNVSVTDANGCVGSFTNIIVKDCVDTSGGNPNCKWKLFLNDSISLFTQNCINSVLFCVPAAADSLEASIDNKIVKTTPCAGNNYAFFTLPDAGKGAYNVTSWTVNKAKFSGQFNSIKGLVDSMNTWNPSGKWVADTTFFLIFGGNNANDYGPLDLQYNGGVVPQSFVLNFMKAPVGSFLKVPSGNHLLVFKNTITGCKDSLYANVKCAITTKHDIDTVYVKLYLNEKDSACMDLKELKGAVQSSNQYCSKVYVAKIEAAAKPACFTFTGLNLGTDTTCIVSCDANGFCDTTIVIIQVIKRFEDIYDTITIDQQKKVCVHGGDYGLVDPLTVTNTCPAKSGNKVIFGIVKNCIDYTGVDIGTDTACIKVCDAKGTCGTFKVYVTVTPSNFKEVIYDTVFVDQKKDTCINFKSLKGSQTTMVNTYINQKLNANFTLDNIKHCVSYKGVNIGNDTAKVVLCDKFNNCDEVTYYIHVRYPGPTARNDFDTVAVTQTVVISRIMKNDSIPGGLKSMNVISKPRWGEVKTLSENKIAYVAIEEPCPAIDTFRYAICNVAGCDTATVFIYIRCINIHVNTGFSPNNDGVNDAFHVNDIELFPNSDLRIFNRWGNMVFNTIGYKNDWTGTWHDGEVLPDGTYFYCLDLKDKDKTVLSGYVQIQR